MSGRQLGAIATVLAIASSLWTAAIQYQAHIREDEKRDEKIRVLQRMFVAEFPAYSAAFYYEEK